MASEQSFFRSLAPPYYSLRIKYGGYRFDSGGGGGRSPAPFHSAGPDEKGKNFLHKLPKIHQLKDAVVVFLLLKK